MVGCLLMKLLSIILGLVGRDLHIKYQILYDVAVASCANDKRAFDGTGLMVYERKKKG
jgi:hypothetical protein